MVSIPHPIVVANHLKVHLFVYSVHVNIWKFVASFPGFIPTFQLHDGRRMGTGLGLVPINQNP